MNKLIGPRIQSSLITFLSLLLLTLLTFFNALHADFISDDIQGIVQNTQIMEASSLFINGIFFMRPLELYLSYQMGGMEPVYYRLFNVIFHFGTVWMLYLVLRDFFHKRTAFISAALFAVHPLVTEAVVWISAFSYTHYAFYILVTLYFYIQYSKSSKKTHALISLISFLLAMMSSEKAVVFPIILTLYDWQKNKYWKFKPIYLLYAAISILLFISPFLNAAPRTSEFQLINNNQTDIIRSLIVGVPDTLSNYLQLFIFPNRLSFYHGSDAGISHINVFINSVIFLLLILSLILTYKKQKILFFWLMFFVILLTPTLFAFGLVQSSAERYTYPALAGLIATCIWILDRYVKNIHIFYAVCIVLIFSMTVRTMIRNMDWESEDRFWIATVKTSPTNGAALNNAGTIYLEQGRCDIAMPLFQRVVRYRPKTAEAYYNLGLCYRSAGEIERAIKSFRTTLIHNPRIIQAHLSLAQTYIQVKDYERAKQELRILKSKGVTNPAIENLLRGL